MAIKLLSARYVAGRGYRFRVHLDTAMVLADGSPNPDWVRSWTYGENPPPGVTVTNYRTNIQAQTKALAQLAAQELTEDAGTALPSEGQEI